jgi:predicted transcriptional regulator
MKWSRHDLVNAMNWRGIGMTYAEIGRLLGRSETAVKERLVRPRKTYEYITQERDEDIYENNEAAKLRKKLYGQLRYEDRT